MIAGIDKKYINVFLTEQERMELNGREITGTIVYLNESRKQKTISLSVDDSRMDKKSRGAYLENDENDNYKLFITSEKEKNFRRNGIAIMTYGIAANHYKIYLVDEKAAKGNQRTILTNVRTYKNRF